MHPPFREHLLILFPLLVCCFSPDVGRTSSILLRAPPIIIRRRRGGGIFRGITCRILVFLVFSLGLGFPRCWWVFFRGGLESVEDRPVYIERVKDGQESAKRVYLRAVDLIPQRNCTPILRKVAPGYIFSTSTRPDLSAVAR